MLSLARSARLNYNVGVSTLRNYSSFSRAESAVGQRQMFVANILQDAKTQRRQFSVSTLKLTDSVKEELVFNVPDKPMVEAEVETPVTSEPVFSLPDKPSPVEISSLGEPSLDSLGLASWWPSGRVQYLLENLHIGLGLEWFQAIAVATLMMRMMMVPVVVMAQKNMANMNNNMPAMSALQEKISDARRRGDMFEMAQLTQELQVYSKKKGINPLKNAVPLFLQVPVFMSFFLGLRGMTNCPVESMSSGGIFWFENLTLTDPFYILPLLTSSTLFLQVINNNRKPIRM